MVLCNQYDRTISIYQNKVPFEVAPTIATQPVDQAVGAESPATFTVVAAGSPPFSYQWSFDGTVISGATNSSYTVTNVQPADAGTYAVVVSN